ncbi:MAG TPA: hypothetical protein RMH99_06945 [Sandaracinaceae bacterium LLY-WYZ-13_1]|nr:hypothetical protein [Sandaracinaceae bacterium LLY-WYZ-13_1]
MSRPFLVLGLALAIGCGGEPGPEPRPQSTPQAASRPHSEAAAPESAGDAPTGEERPEGAAPEGDEAAGAPAAPTEPDFDAPFPEEACPDEVRVRLAHRNADELPPLLDRAVAYRSGDGQRVRIAVANHPLELDERGRFAAPTAGQARFEADAVRRRRGPLEPRTLGPPDSRRGGLTHARIVTPGPLLTFGTRDIGHVELTEVTEERVCGRIDLDDGFGRVRGAFTAPVRGPLPP